MQTYMFAAGVLALVVGAAHSLLGEILIFRHLRNGSLVPAMRAPPLRERHIRILWATWHLTTVLGWAFGAILISLAVPGSGYSLQEIVVGAAVLAFLVGSLLVLVGTKGRHPGWMGLLGVAALAWFAASAS